MAGIVRIHMWVNHHWFGFISGCLRKWDKSLLRFLVKCELWNSKSNYICNDCIFCCRQSSLWGLLTNHVKKKQTKWIKIYQSQLTDVTFWPGWSELLFPGRSAQMIDGSKKHKPLVEDWISEFAFHWNRNKQITKRSNGKPKQTWITFHNQVKIPIYNDICF